MKTLQDISSNLELADLRRISKMSQKQAADAIGVSTRTWYIYEAHPEKMRIETLLRVAQVFGVEPSDILKVKGVSNGNGNSNQYKTLLQG